MKMHISNLSQEVQDGELAGLFSVYGEVTFAEVARDRATGRSKGAAIVEMPIPAEGQKAMRMLDNQLVQERRISVSEIM